MSGGADSMALLWLMAAPQIERPAWAPRVVAAHVNHRLRDAQANDLIIQQGAIGRNIFFILEGQVEASMEVYERDTMVSMLISKEKIAEAKEDLLERVRNADIKESGTIHAFADQSERIHAQIEENLLELGSDEFGGVLRPVFQKDEWKLVLAGGVIGTIIGALQVVFLFGGFKL